MSSIHSTESGFVQRLTDILGQVNAHRGYLRVNKAGDSVVVEYEPKANTLGGKIVQYFRHLFTGSFNVNRNISLLVGNLRTQEESDHTRAAMYALEVWDRNANNRLVFNCMRSVEQVKALAREALAPVGRPPAAAAPVERPPVAAAPAAPISVVGSSLRGEKIAVKGDGNCLYHSLQWGLEDHQAFLALHGLQAGQITHGQIRGEVSDRLASMLRDDEGFADHFLGVLMNANEQTEEKISTCQATRDFLASEGRDTRELDRQIEELEGQMLEAPADYVAAMRRDKFFGGEVEIIAFANRYCMNVKVLEQTSAGIEDTGLPVITPKREVLAELGISEEEVPTIYIIAQERHYDYFRPLSSEGS